MSEHRIIVIGASAGGVETLLQLVERLPSDFPAPILIVLHIASNSRSVLPSILSRHGDLPAKHAVSGEPIQPGQIYVAPPNCHLLVRPGTIALVKGPRENGHRPAVDPLFHSAARVYGPRVIGVVLSGTRDDGTVGLMVIKQRGGITIAQQPEDALFDSMPQSAIDSGCVDYVMPIAEIPSLLTTLIQKPVGSPPDANPDVPEAEVSEADLWDLRRHEPLGAPSTFSCPTCGGCLWELNGGKKLRFRCRVGHSFTAEKLLEDQSEAVENALWSAVRALEERSTLLKRMADRASNGALARIALGYQEKSQEAQEQADQIRRLLLDGELESLA